MLGALPWRSRRLGVQLFLMLRIPSPLTRSDTATLHVKYMIFTIVSFLAATRCVVAESEPGVHLLHRLGMITQRDGKPIMGAVVRVIDVDCVRSETGFFPESCSGVGKLYVSSVTGEYELTDLDPRLRYYLSVAAPGFQVKLLQYVEPQRVDTLKTTLAPIAKDRPESDALEGKVLDQEGKPIKGAWIEIAGETTRTANSRSDTFGALSGVDHYGVTDSDGAFHFPCKGSGRTFYVRLSAIGFAPQSMILTSGTDAAGGNAVRLSRGVSIRGRLVKDGQPLAGRKMLLCQVNDNSDTYIGMLKAGTAGDGRFTIEHVPENMEFKMAAAPSSLGSRGATKIVNVKSASNAGEATDVGDVAVGPALTLSGRLFMDKGAALPQNMSVTVTPTQGIESLNMKVNPDGTFELAGLSPGPVELSFYEDPQVRVAEDNPCEWNHGHALLGKMESDTKLNVHLVPTPKGPDTGGGWTGDQYRDALARPLQGVANEPGK